jgi:K+-transporting ATPase A subunit
MWSGAQQENRNGWVIALIWAVATLVLMEGSHALHDGLFPHGDSVPNWGLLLNVSTHLYRVGVPLICCRFLHARCA